MSQWLSFTTTRSAPAASAPSMAALASAVIKPAQSVILCSMPRIDRIGLILVNDAGYAFHVDRDVDPHGWLLDGLWRSRMRALNVCGSSGIAVALAACAPRGEQKPRTLLEQGRMYTAWLYGSQYQKLWDRFSPEMRQTFGTVGDLASFAGRAVNRLGPERRAMDERVDGRRALPGLQPHRLVRHSTQPMLIEWSLAKDGAVTGSSFDRVPDEEPLRRSLQ